MRTKLVTFFVIIEIRNFKNAAINNRKNVNKPSDGAWFSVNVKGFIFKRTILISG